jgi:putative hydrolase of HD superfamily
MRFIIEIDKLKSVFRQTHLMNGERRENDAEHSWHLAVMAALLSEYAAERDFDLLRVMKMVLIHDVVEIDAGDVFVYDRAEGRRQSQEEKRAADRIFNILPLDQAKEMRELWEEFEARETPEARFAAALDRLQPMLHNYQTRGGAWQEHRITSDMVIQRNRHIAEGARELWAYAEELVREAIQNGYLEK